MSRLFAATVMSAEPLVKTRGMPAEGFFLTTTTIAAGAKLFSRCVTN